MSAELIGTVITAAGLLISIMGGFGWMIHRMDGQSARMEENVNARFDQVNARMDGLQHEMTEVKIAVARLEGPRPRIAMPG